MQCYQKPKLLWFSPEGRPVGCAVVHFWPSWRADIGPHSCSNVGAPLALNAPSCTSLHTHTCTPSQLHSVCCRQRQWQGDGVGCSKGCSRGNRVCSVVELVAVMWCAVCVCVEGGASWVVEKAAKLCNYQILTFLRLVRGAPL